MGGGGGVDGRFQCSNSEDGSGLDFKCSSSMGSRVWGHLSVVVCGVGTFKCCGVWGGDI